MKEGTKREEGEEGEKEEKKKEKTGRKEEGRAISSCTEQENRMWRERKGGMMN
jgi:hypothetical protein